MVPFSVTKTTEEEGVGVEERFWGSMESLLCVSMQYWNRDYSLELQRLMASKNDKCWGLLCRGSRVLFSGRAETIVKVVTHYSRGTVRFGGDKDFEEVMKKHHVQLVKETTRRVPNCLHLQIQGFSGWLPDPFIKCPDCGDMVQRMILYRCCHKSKIQPHAFPSLFAFLPNPTLLQLLDNALDFLAQAQTIPYAHLWIAPVLVLLLLFLFPRFLF